MKHILFFALIYTNVVFSQDDGSQSESGTNKLFETKEQMMASVNIGKSPMNFMQKDFRVGNFTNIAYNSQWAMVSFGYGDIKFTNPDLSVDTVRLKEIAVGGSFPIKKLAIGHRIYDMNGYLILPILSGQIGVLNLREQKSYSAKISPTLSFQFPFVGIDLKMHTNFYFKNQIPGLKNFSFTPEISLKFDGLYNLLDAEKDFIGHVEGTITSRHTGYSTESKREGNYIITTTYKNEWTEVTPYSFDRYATLIGPMVAIGPYYTFQNKPYAGTTKLFGLAYHLRLGLLSSDIMVDAGKIGFGDQLKEESTFQNPNSKNFVGLDKEKFRNIGSYSTQRAQVRLGIDIYEIFMSRYGAAAAVSNEEGKFTRFIGGLGFGYANVGAPKYNLINGEQLSDADFDANSNLLSVSANHPKFASNGAFTSLYFSFEAGAIRITFEANRYFRAQLANTKSISVGYMFPYNRIKKKMFIINSFKN